MSNEQAENKDTPAAQAAPGAGSAPATNATPVAGSKVETTQAAKPEDSKPSKGVETEFFKLRSERRELRETVTQKDTELAQLKAEVEALKKAQKEPSRSGKESAETDFFDDPKASLDKVKADSVALAKDEIRKELESVQERHRVETAMKEAGEMLLTRSHIKQDPNFAREVGALVNLDPQAGPIGKYADIAVKDPHSAAKLAYLEVCEARGVAPDFSKSSNAHNASSGIKPSVSGPSEAPIIHEGDLRRGKVTRADVEKAIKEGRYRGPTIKI